MKRNNKMAKFTKEQKAEYFKGLREEWTRIKKLSEGDKTAKAVFEASGLSGISFIGFQVVLAQMKKLGLDGLPYVDTKTFQKWKQSGFQVKKGEKSKIHGITWIDIADKDDIDEIVIPKVYHLFHKTQVEEIKQ